MASCPSNTQCQTNYLADIQTHERSSADQTGLLAGKTLYGYENAATVRPAFKSGADYIRWKKTVSQLYATSQKLTSECR
jgi:hypothetical protein